jgi:L-glyceraldehyde 3-phosphate reductase
MWPGPFGKGGSRKYLLASLDQSLKRMNLDYVDVFYHHCMDAETPLEESISALAHAVHAGKALYVGLSNYSPEQAKKAFELLKAEGVPCLVEQSAYSMLNRSPEDGLLDTLKEYGVGFAAYSPLAQGMLSGKYNKGVPKDSRAGGYSKFLNSERLTDEIHSKIIALGDIADSRDQTMAQLALAWLLHNPSVTTVIIGASRAAQLLENIKAVENITFTNAEIKKIKEAID